MDHVAEIFDQVQRLFDTLGFNDHQLHCVLRFASRPDPEILRKSVIASIEAIPILGTRYIADGRPRWSSLDRGDFGRAFAVVRSESAFEEFLVSRGDESSGPQVAVCLLDAASSAVALKMDHMVSDAAGFKSYLYLLSGIYSGLMADPDYRPSRIDGDRSTRGVLDRFGIGAKLKALLLENRDNNLTGGPRFPLEEGGAVRPFVLTRKVGRERVAALKDYGRATGSTLNDIALAAFYRCLFQRLATSPGAALAVPVMVDMRRYLGAAEQFTALTNLSSMVRTELARKPGEGFAATLGRVKAIMDGKKAGDIGLNAFAKLALLFQLCGDRVANRVLRFSLKQPPICMTNIGILDADRLAFGGQRPVDAFMSGSIKYKPYFQLAMSSYDGAITLSVNQYGTDADRTNIAAFLAEIEAALPGQEALPARAGVPAASTEAV
jgi:NRPS condensation-like uncharacterized protein